jgi:hypothetical protein
MKINFKGNQLIDNFVGSSLKTIDNNLICKIVSLILIVYIILIVPYMLNHSIELTKNIVSLSNNTIFKLLIYLVIGLIAESNIQLALFMMLALLVSENTIIKYEFNQYILDIIIKDQQNKQNVEVNKPIVEVNKPIGEVKKLNLVENLRNLSRPAPYVKQEKKFRRKIKKLESPKIQSPSEESQSIQSQSKESQSIQLQSKESQFKQSQSIQSPAIKKIENEYESFNNNDNNNFSYLE